MSDTMSYVTHKLGQNGLKFEKFYEYNYDDIIRYSDPKSFENQCINS